jgi:hypothetical protein
MWQWIAEVWLGGYSGRVEWLKYRWLRDNNIRTNLRHACYFCEYAKKQFWLGIDRCDCCPGRMVDGEFYCEGSNFYAWFKEPLAFYNKLLQLNEKRLAKQ